MSSWPTKPLGEIAAGKRKSVDPSKHADEIFDLYSIPAYDEGKPEIAEGREIGSAKNLFDGWIAF